MVRITSSFIVIGAGLVASAVAGPLRSKRGDNLSAVFVPKGSSIGQGCELWESQCKTLAGVKSGSVCMDDQSVESALLVTCIADGNTITGDVIEAYGWHSVYPARVAKRDEGVAAVYIHEGSSGVGQGCDRWERQCKGLADGGNTGAIWSTSCEADSAVDNAILVSCNANGNIITGDVAEAYDWHFVAPQQAHAKAAKRDFILTPVYIPEGSDSASQGCDRWERQCKGIVQGGNPDTKWSTSCKADLVIENAILVSCALGNYSVTNDVMQVYGWQAVV